MSKKRSSRTGKKNRRVLEQINHNAAGADMGAREVWIAVGDHVSDEPVQKFGTTTNELQRSAEWMRSCAVDTVAMEATAVYSVAAFESAKSTVESSSGEFPGDPELQRDEEERLHRLPVAASAAHIRDLAGFASRRRGDDLVARLLSSASEADRESIRAYSAHAKGAGAHECATLSGRQRHHCSDHHEDPSHHSESGARS